jgi:hypothetical protein
MKSVYSAVRTGSLNKAVKQEHFENSYLELSRESVSISLLKVKLTLTESRDVQSGLQLYRTIHWKVRADPKLHFLCRTRQAGSKGGFFGLHTQSIYLLAVCCSSTTWFPHCCISYHQTMQLTSLLTPWSRVLLEKLTGLQLVKKFPRILWKPKVHHRTHKRTPPVPVLSQPHPVHTPTSHFPKIHPNIILPSTPWSPQWSPSLQVSSPKPCTHLSPPTYALHAPPISFFLILSPTQYWVESTPHHKLDIKIPNKKFSKECIQTIKYILKYKLL